jgi:hypothetical protein
LPRVLAACLSLRFAVLQGILTRTGSFVLVPALWMILSGIASAHAFSAALLVVGEDREASLAEAVCGFLLAVDVGPGPRRYGSLLLAVARMLEPGQAAG